MALSTTTTTITPLMMATSVSMETIPGLDVNPEFNSNILIYENATHVSSNFLGEGLDGTLKSDGDAVYSEFYVSDIIPGAESQSFNNDDGTVVTGNLRPVRNYLGQLSSFFTDAWVFDGKVYRGSLSAFGGQIADRISSGYLGPTTLEKDTTAGPLGNYGWHVVNRTPSYDGKYVLYYGDPTKQTLGADTIPALTQTVPASITSITGAFTYWLDQAVSRPLGKTKVTDQAFLTRALGLTQGFVTTSNRYLQATRNTEDYSLKDLGYKSYQDLVSQGWLVYKQGKAISLALRNIGAMITAVPVGIFGTPGGVAYVLINTGLGNIGGLDEKILSQDVNLNDIGNPMYAAVISKILSEITDPIDLELIQEGIKSSIPNMTSALDYIYIDKCAGMDNDSAFATFVDVGVDLMTKTAYLTAETGSDLVTIIEKIQTPYSATVEAQAGPTSLLKPEITNLFRSRLPVSATDESITILDVIGSPCGYYNTAMAELNQGIQDLDNTPWGPQIRSALKDIASAVFALRSFTDLGYLPNTEYVDNATAYTNETALNNAVNHYNELLNNIVNDSSVSNIVAKINDNYLYICQRVLLETQNRAKLTMLDNLNIGGFDTMDFASRLHQYAVDMQGQGAGIYVAGLVQPNATGDLITSTMAEGYNYALIGNVNIAPNGYVA